MNFKPELLAKVLAGEKTQTRRIKKPGETLWMSNKPFSQLPSTVSTPKGKLKWEVGRVYAAAPGRGRHGEGFIKLIGMREECVGDITNAGARMEGFADKAEFFEAWDRINGKNKRNVTVWVLTFELAKVVA